MPTYAETVLAKSPVLYYRLDELTGAVMTDSSGFNRHGVLYPEVEFGLASPIETDAASHAMRRRVGKLTPIPAAADVRTNFTWECWIFLKANSSPHTAICRNGHWSLNASNIFGYTGSENIVAKLRVGGVDHTLSYANGVPGNWYHCVLTRNGAVMRLWINAVLVGEDVTLALTDIQIGTSVAWYIGLMHVDEGVWWTEGLDEVAIYDYPLSETQIIENYEAALNSIFLRGYSNVIPTAVLSSLIEPDPVGFPWRHNWDSALIERIQFATAISITVNGREEGNGLRSAPRREFELAQILRDNDERREFRAKLWAQQGRKWFVSVRQDAELSSALSAGATIIPIDTQYKDYEVDSWVEVRESTNQWLFEQAQVDSLNPLTLRTPLVNSYSFPLVMPARRAYISPSLGLRGHTDAVEDFTVVARLIAEDEEVVPNRIVPWVPTTKYRDYEIHEPSQWQSNDWSELREYTVERAVETVDFDTGVFSEETDTAGAVELFSYRMTLEGRDKIAALLGWFYARTGSLNYVWVPSMQRDMEVLEVDGSELLVKGHSYTDNYAGAESRRDLAFVYNNNSMELRRILSATAQGDNDLLTLDVAIPTLVNLRSLSLLKFCRLEADQVEIAWHTDNVAQFAWSFRELLHTSEGTGPTSLSPSASPSGSPSPSGSLSASGSPSPSSSVSPSISPSASQSPSASISRSPSLSPSPSASFSPSSSPSASQSPSASPSPSV